jgi:hypothetical protein
MRCSISSGASCGPMSSRANRRWSGGDDEKSVVWSLDCGWRGARARRHGGAGHALGSGKVDDDEQHAIVLTIWNSEIDAKVYWKPLDGDKERTTTIQGNGVHAFQTNGEFKIQAVGDGDREVKYNYVLLHLRKK